MSYVPYHVHSVYSIRDGSATPHRNAQRASELSLPALAITDHRNCHGIVAHTKACRDFSIKPIIGIEANVLHFDEDNKSRGCHAVIIALNNTGYSNMLHIIRESYKHYYYVPRIPEELLHKYNEGLLVTSACVGGILGKPIENGKKPIGRYERYVNSFGDRFKGEIQPVYRSKQDADENYLRMIEMQTALNNFVLNTFPEHNVFCANDSHYAYPEDHERQTVIAETILGGHKYENYYYIWDYEQLIEWPGIPKYAVDNTLQLLDMVEFEMTLGEYQFPEVELPENETDFSYLVKLSYDGLKKKFKKPTSEYYKRLDYELSVIKSNNTAPYFIVNYRIFAELRRQGIMYGPRGSACGSLVAFCLELHDIDPIKYNIMFERFMTPGRASLPDIDYDFKPEDRERAFQIVEEMYGRSRVSRITTFQEQKLRSSILDIGRIYVKEDKIKQEEVTALSKKVDKDVTKFSDLEKKNDGNSLRKYINKSSAHAEMVQKIKLVSDAEIIRSKGMHACGIVIAPRDVHTIWPVLYDKKKDLMAVQFDMESIEEAGGLKMDFLGLTTLDLPDSILGKLELILNDIPLEDPKVYEFIQRDSMHGLFQAKSPKMKEIIRNMKPTEINDLAVAVAACRPAVLEQKLDQLYINRKNKIEPVQYPHPDLEPILKDKYGIFLYQDDTLRTCMEALGMTGLEADKIRKAAAKKKEEEMAKLKPMFVKHAEDKYWNRKVIEHIWDIFSSGASYGFNYSHAFTYGRWLYISAWLKLYYPELFYQISLTSRQSAVRTDDEGRLFLALINDCASKGYKFRKPDINSSTYEFVYNENDKTFSYSLCAIKGVGKDVVKWIIEHRPFLTYQDILDRAEKYKVLSGHRKHKDLLLSNLETHIANRESKTFKLNKIRRKYDPISMHMSTMYPMGLPRYIIKKALTDYSSNKYITGSVHRYESFMKAQLYRDICYMNPVMYQVTIRWLDSYKRKLLNIGVVESLTLCGALDEIGDRRELLKAIYEEKTNNKKEEAIAKIPKFFEMTDKELDAVCKSLSGYTEAEYESDPYFDADYDDDLTMTGQITFAGPNREGKSTGFKFHMFVMSTEYGNVMCYCFDNLEEYEEHIIKKNIVTVTGKKMKDKFNRNQQLLRVESIYTVK